AEGSQPGHGGDVFELLDPHRAPPVLAIRTQVVPAIRVPGRPARLIARFTIGLIGIGYHALSDPYWTVRRAPPHAGAHDRHRPADPAAARGRGVQHRIPARDRPLRHRRHRGHLGRP